MSTAAELLAEVKSLLAQKQLKPTKETKREKREPVGQSEYLEEYLHTSVYLPVHYRVFQVLAPVGFEWDSTVINWYYGELHDLNQWYQNYLEDKYRYDNEITRIIHGHPRSQITCRFQDQCHVLGYQPTGEEHQNFLERWKKFGYSE